MKNQDIEQIQEEVLDEIDISEIEEYLDNEPTVDLYDVPEEFEKISLYADRFGEDEIDAD